MLLPAPGHLGDLWLFCPPSVPLVPFTVSVKSIQTHTKSNVLPYDTEELWPVNIRWAEGEGQLFEDYTEKQDLL